MKVTTVPATFALAGGDKGFPGHRCPQTTSGISSTCPRETWMHKQAGQTDESGLLTVSPQYQGVPLISWLSHPLC